MLDGDEWIDRAEPSALLELAYTTLCNIAPGRTHQTPRAPRRSHNSWRQTNPLSYSPINNRCGSSGE